MKNVAVIPARGGSKRIRKKNIREIGGIPLIGWPIKTAIKSNCFDRIIVSTDDSKIATVARQFGAETPFLRSPELSDDYTGTTEVVSDAIERMDLNDEDRVCCIYPTAIFLEESDLIEGINMLTAGVNWVFSVGKFRSPIDRAYRFDGKKLVPRNIKMMLKRTQDCESTYFDCGQFYWALASTWNDPEKFVWDGAVGVEIPKNRAIDIDDEDDLNLADLYFEVLRRS